MTQSGRGRKKDAKQLREPLLGIFWLVDRKLLIESARLGECERYGDHLNYPGSHIDVWEQWKRIGEAPPDSEYEEFGRGRLMCDTKTKSFRLLADPCILKRKDLVAKIKNELRLPKQTSLWADAHYRCSTCLHRAGKDE
jgi:hypothetical protein